MQPSVKTGERHPSVTVVQRCRGGSSRARGGSTGSWLGEGRPRPAAGLEGGVGREGSAGVGRGRVAGICVPPSLHCHLEVTVLASSFVLQSLGSSRFSALPY